MKEVEYKEIRNTNKEIRNTNKEIRKSNKEIMKVTMKVNSCRFLTRVSIDVKP